MVRGNTLEGVSNGEMEGGGVLYFLYLPFQGHIHLGGGHSKNYLMLLFLPGIFFFLH